MTTPKAPAPAASASPSADRLRGRLMAQSLGRLLDRVRGAREVLPHLAALERSLFAVGLAAVDRASPVGLAKMCSQLSSLPLPADDPPLHDLLSRLMDALESPAKAAPVPPPATRRALPSIDERPFDIEQTVIIEEVSHSDFMRVAYAGEPTQRDDTPHA
jgi:hypothetical protein